IMPRFAPHGQPRRGGAASAWRWPPFGRGLLWGHISRMNNSINHRELTYKAVAGLAGGALGWLPVELASHGRNLTDVMSTGDIIAAYVTMAILSGLIGGLILASDEQKFELTPTVRNRFILGFVVCFILAIPANYYSNIVFSEI